MAGVDGIKPPFADLESAVLLTELNSKKAPVNRQELHLRGKYSAYLRLRGYRHKKALHWSAVHDVA